MLKVGVTGGIGSGKTMVCQVFAALGIPVFNADNAARYLMENDGTLKQRIAQLLGDEVYAGGKLDRNKVAEIIYRQPEKLNQLNSLVHPATIQYGKDWLDSQTSAYVIKEAAIFFESGSDKDMDVMVGVFAPVALRIQRSMKRSGKSETQIRDIMAQQMDEDEKMRRCDYVITNDEQQAVLPQVLRLHEQLLKRASIA